MDTLEDDFEGNLKVDESALKETKKRKKKNITEILELKKDEFNDPNYSRNEFKKMLTNHIEKNLSTVEKQSLNLNDDSIEKIILKTNKLYKSIGKAVKAKLSKKFDILNGKKQTKNNPYCLVLCSSAQRCIQVQKELNLITINKIRWMYAFAKHKKLPEQVDFLNKNIVNLIYGTPSRITQLIETNEALKLNRLRYVIIDYNHRDCKLKRFIDINEIKQDFLKLFFEHIQPCNKEKVKIKFLIV